MLAVFFSSLAVSKVCKTIPFLNLTEITSSLTNHTWIPEIWAEVLGPRCSKANYAQITKISPKFLKFILNRESTDTEIRYNVIK